MKKSSTLKLIMNISFLSSICIHRSIFLIFIAKKKSMLVNFFPQKIFCSAIFDFHFCDEFQALMDQKAFTFRCVTKSCVSRIKTQKTKESKPMHSSMSENANQLSGELPFYQKRRHGVKAVNKSIPITSKLSFHYHLTDKFCKPE